MIDLTGRTALVTGANQGIGWGVARLLAQQGACVAVNYPDDEHFPAAIAELGAVAIAVKADVGRLPAIQTMFAELRRRWDRLDILVNNAGIFPRAAFLEMDEAVWDRVQDVNLKGLVFCSQQAAGWMVERGAPGRIVNLSSISALRPDERGVHYTASKAAVIAATKSMALALAPHRIAVNAVAPGLTDTAQPRYGLTEEQILEREKQIPWGRMAQPEDIARAVLYLASDLSEYVTGQTLFVTGGHWMVP